MTPLKDFYSKLSKVWNLLPSFPTSSTSLEKQILILYGKANECDNCKIGRNRCYYSQLLRYSLKPHPFQVTLFLCLCLFFKLRVIELKTWFCKVCMKQNCSLQSNQGLTQPTCLSLLAPPHHQGHTSFGFGNPWNQKISGTLESSKSTNYLVDI